MTAKMPSGPLMGPAAWTGERQARRDDWVELLSSADAADLEAALAAARALGRPLAEIGAAEFPLPPRMRSRIESWTEDLENGRGFVLVRGVPVEGKTRADCELMYWGIGAHLGRAVSQNAAGDVLGHVRDTGADPSDPSVRLYRTRETLGFHTDGADIIGLMCLRTARRGGVSRIASSVSVFNEIQRRRPDLLPLLFEPFPFDRNEEQAAGEPPYFELPLCSFDGEHLRMFYIGWYIRDSQRHVDAPRLSAAQRQLIDLIDEIADSPGFALEMDFRPGDIQLLKNSTILHARTEFEDFAEPERKRHLLRLWLTGHRPLAGGDALLQSGIPKKDGAAGDSGA